jgi:ankyrin repeat protein
MMKSVNPILLIVLAGVIAMAVFLKVTNPYKKYSQQAYWRSATVSNVKEIPNEALLRGNKNGPVLMWAAMAANDPKIIAALVERGADANEPDIMFSGTPLSAAAGYSTNPAIVDELVRLGAKIDKVVGSEKKTPLIIAAEINPKPEIAESLIKNGADTAYRDLTGRNALEAAIKFENASVVKVLKENTK